MKEMVGGCCVCSDERGWDENPLVYCDGGSCSVAVHQACYGIVTVPSGPWYCRRCESQERSSRLRCELCPSKDGAFKKTDGNGWAHVVCALYIPEVRFGNVTTMEPIQVSLIPQERYNKNCYICEENNRESKKNVGAFMQCNKAGCKQNFHVTCAQFLGLLCEEAGNMMDNVKYCGYCQYHYSKLKKTSNMKIIPPFKPIPSGGGTDSPQSSPEKSNPKGSSGLPSTTNETLVSASGNGTTAPTTACNISPDIDNVTRSSSTKGSNKRNSANNKSGSKNPNGTNSSPSPIPRIQPSNLFPTTVFSGKACPPGEPERGKGHNEEESSSQDGGSTIKSEPKLNACSPTSSLLPAPFVLKNKDFATVSMNDVVSAALDRPMSSVGSKFDRPPAGTEPGTHSGGSNSSCRSEKPPPPPPDIKPHVTLTPIPMRSDESKSDSQRSSLSFSSTFGQPNNNKLQVSPEAHKGLDTELATLEKTSPPGKRARLGPEKYDSDTESATEEDERPDREESESNSHSQVARAHFSRMEGYQAVGKPGPPPLPLPPPNPSASRMLTQAQAKEMSLWESSSTNKSPTVSLERIRFGDEEALTAAPSFRPTAFPNEFLNPGKRGPGRPPAKPRSGQSRDEESRERKVPAKRGRRGGGAAAAATVNNYPRRDNPVSNSNGSLMEDNSFDDPAESAPASVNNASARGGRHSGGIGRKPVGSTGNASKKPHVYDDTAAPTLAQLKAQMAAGAGSTPEKALAPHMFGNVINPTSSMAQRLVDNLSQEMEMAAAGGGTNDSLSPQAPIVGVPFPGKSASTTPKAKPGPSTAPTTNGSPPKGPAAPNQPQTLEELLERQWEQGSQFLMEQAQHLDIAQLLSCLNQLKQDNKALEDHVASLCQRKEQLTAINARLNIPLSSSGTLAAVGASPAVGLHSSKAPAPYQQLQQQVQEEAMRHQNRLITHIIPGTEGSGHSHGQAHHSHGHGHSSHGHRPGSGSSSQGQMYGYPGHVPSGHPVPVVTSLSHPSPHLSNNTHHSSHPPPRDSR